MARNHYVNQLRMNDRVALVLGGGRGVGGAAADALADAGASVVVADRDESYGTGRADKIRDAGGTASFYRADVLVDQDISGAVANALESFGRLDVLVNAAGGSYHTADGHEGFLDQTLDTWDILGRMNLGYVVRAIRAAVPHFIEAGAGAIVNVSSTTAQRGPFETAYGAAKAGLENLTRSLAFELGPAGIRTNAVAPGPLATDRLLEHGVEATRFDAMFADVIPLQRVARPEDIGSAILFLASDLASFVNGAVLPVEGGIQTFAPELRTLIAARWMGPTEAYRR